jgi:hypothetical protein
LWGKVKGLAEKEGQGYRPVPGGKEKSSPVRTLEVWRSQLVA